MNDTKIVEGLFVIKNILVNYYDLYIQHRIESTSLEIFGVVLKAPDLIVVALLINLLVVFILQFKDSINMFYDVADLIWSSVGVLLWFPIYILLLLLDFEINTALVISVSVSMVFLIFIFLNTYTYNGILMFVPVLIAKITVLFFIAVITLFTFLGDDKKKKRQSSFKRNAFWIISVLAILFTFTRKKKLIHNNSYANFFKLGYKNAFENNNSESIN